MKFLYKLADAYRLIFGTSPLRLEQTDYDSYWRDKRGATMGALNSFQEARARWILPRITPGSTVLDVGCGDGAVLQYLTKRASFHAIGADVSKVALQHLQSQGIQTIPFDSNDFEAIRALPEVDHIMLFEILEHMQNPERFLSLIQTKARKSVFFSFPNSGYFAYRLRLLFGRSIKQWRLHPGEHLRYWTYADLTWWLRELSLDTRTTFTVYEGLPGLNRLWPSLFGMAFVGEIISATDKTRSSDLTGMAANTSH